MTTLDALLRMPRWSKREWAWEQLTTGRTLLDALHQAVQDGQVEQAVQWLNTWESFVREQGGQVERQWTILSSLLWCAKIAALSSERASQLPALLPPMGLQTLALDRPRCQAAATDSQTWRQFLREQIYADRESMPLGAETTWDVVTTLMGNPRPVTHLENLGVLLVAREGIVARLALERLGDQGRGELYPDPAMMAFVTRAADFASAEQNAVVFIRAQGLWKAHCDVRWRLARQDGRPLTRLEGGSAGGAFALGLAKLFAEEQ